MSVQRDERQSRYRGDRIGWGPWRATWYDICSRHPPGYLQLDCHMCMAGYYVNDLAHRVSHYFYGRHYRLWHWWVNRPNAKDRRHIERIFPRHGRSRADATRREEAPARDSARDVVRRAEGRSRLPNGLRCLPGLEGVRRG